MFGAYAVRARRLWTVSGPTARQPEQNQRFMILDRVDAARAVRHVRAVPRRSRPRDLAVLSTGALVGHLAPPVAPSGLWSSWNWDPVLWTMPHRRPRRPHPRLGPGSPVGTPPLAAPGVPRRHRDGRCRAALAARCPQRLAGLGAHGPAPPAHGRRRAAPRPERTDRDPATRAPPPCPRADLDHVRHAVRVRPRHLVRAHPIAGGVVFAATLWVWHAAGPYELALRNHLGAPRRTRHVPRRRGGLVVGDRRRHRAAERPGRDRGARAVRPVRAGQRPRRVAHLRPGTVVPVLR